jgi:phage terminase small subunit
MINAVREMEVVHNKPTGNNENENRQVEKEKLYEVLENLPKPMVQMKLSRSQKKWWYWFGYEFVSTKQFTKLDLTHLQKAAFWMDARCQAVEQINQKGYKGGLVQYFASGASNVSAHISILEKADKHLDEVSAHFGLSIKDRQKLKVEEIADNQLSLFEQFAERIYGEV